MAVSEQERHHATLRQLINLLAEERAAFESSDVKRVTELAQAKSAALGELTALLGQLRGKPNPGTQADPSRQVLRDLLQQCLDANRANAALANARIAHLDTRLRPLMQEPVTYGPKRGAAAAYQPRLFARV